MHNKTLKSFIVLAGFALGLASMPTNVSAQDPVIFEIAGKPVYKSQFMKEFLHSIGKDESSAPTACTYEKRKALEDYVELYVNFRTKLTDAYAQGYDTIQSLRNELATYRKELAAPYLIDSASAQMLLREAYERNHYVLHAAHVLVPCTETATPEDTLKAYTHAMELYEQALTTPNFYEVAQQEMQRQRIANRDPKASNGQVNPKEGDLGCFTVFDMIYSFETAVYGMQPGEILKPVRSRYGYHIIKLFDRFEYYGKVQLAHIWASGKDPNARGRIMSAYNLLKEGSDFGTVAKNISDDRTTGDNGGLMPELACNQLPVDYVAKVANGMKVGDVSEPFETDYGWHIIKLVKQETMPSMESMIPYYKQRMTRGERNTVPQSKFIEQSKERYGFVDYTKTKTSKKRNAPYAASLAAIRALVNDSVFAGKFNYDSTAITDMRPLFKIGDKEYNSRQFARHIYIHKKVRRHINLDMFVQERYKEFVDDMVLRYADSRLEQDNPEFGALMEEYLHGLMIFAYNDNMVWSKAVKDTTGFEEFYQMASVKHNYNDTNDAVYFWNERARVNVFTVADSACLMPDKAVKVVNKALSKGHDANGVKDMLTGKLNKRKCTEETPIVSELQILEDDNQTTLSSNEWHKGVYIHPNKEKGYQILIVEKIMPPELKSRMEARGYYLNDYQNYLEEQNNRRLREKYNVKIHQDVIDEITY